MPESSDSAQKGTPFRRSKAGAGPARNAPSPFRLTQAARRRAGRGYSGRGPMTVAKPPRGERSLPAHNTGSVSARRATRHVSVKDVAARSGVSFQTTSKVLNGGGSVSEVTRARILQAASDLGYVPNLQARSLVMQRTQTVGLLAGDFSDQNLSRLIVGAEREARRQGYGVLMAG